MLLFTAVYLVAVRTVPGQRFEDAVLSAAEARAGTVNDERAERVLSLVTTASVAVVAAAVLAIGFARRQWRLGVLAAAVILATVIVTQIMQWALPRPILLHRGYRRDDQSFPSGHTATAMAMMCAVVLVVPLRLRAAVLGAASLFAGGIAVATVTASWHRPSDTLGGELIALAVCCAAVAWLRPRGHGPARALNVLGTVYAAVLVTATALVFAVGPLDAQPGADAALGSALLAGRAIAVAGAAATALALLTVLGTGEPQNRARMAARRGPQLRYR
ncbi:phosphatase PAP2 family protein [Dactylosporangium sp. CA-233914]|uniref:phosphatase PAP2 family protein n=1 Tax=Dactylosporangium sp. CA-233914 TaxID=3239934 RepID=UPI003D939637